MLRPMHYRKFHRDISVIIGIQLALWVISGIYFAWTDLDEIHGDHLRAPMEPLVLGPGWMGPADALRAAGVPDTVGSVDVVPILGETFYRAKFSTGVEPRTVLVGTATGEVRPAVTEEEARAIAQESFLHRAGIEGVVRLEPGQVGPHHEYREGSLPAWRVSFDHGSGTRVYVSAADGQVVTHRNHGWRVFDFLWMLHTMDYLGRDDINNPVLRVLAALALVTVVSGFVLWFQTRPRRRRG